MTVSSPASKRVREERILLDGRRCQLLFRWEAPGCWEQAFVGGALHSSAARSETIADLRDISLMPAYCHTRRFPEKVDGQWLHSAAYVKMPLVCVSRPGESRGLVFPPAVEIGEGRETLHFSFEKTAEGCVFELGFLRDSIVWRKGDESYGAWDDAELVPERHCPKVDGQELKLRFVELEGASWEDIVRRYLMEEAWGEKPPPEVDSEAHTAKALRWLGAVREPESGLFLEWKWRDRPGFKGGLRLNLPCYHTLAGDLARVASRSGDPTLKTWARETLELALRDDASVQLSEGRLWWNTLRYDPLERSFHYRNHLGSGLGGYPGGQATILRSLIEAALDGAEASRLRERIDRGLQWLLMTQRKDGSWARVRYDLAETSGVDLPAGDETSSLGANAEGAWCLLLAHRLNGGMEELAAGLKALHWVNERAGDPPVGHGYLRDNHQEEAEGVSLIFAIFANLAARDTTLDESYLREALRFGLGLSTWQRWWDLPSLDPMAFSFGPRVAPCESAWAAEAYEELFQHSGDSLWRELSNAALSALVHEDPWPGFSEASYYDEKLELHPHLFECVYTASAVLRVGLQRGLGPIPDDLDRAPHWWRAEWPKALRKGRFVLARAFPFLRSLKRMTRLGR